MEGGDPGRGQGRAQAERPPRRAGGGRGDAAGRSANPTISPLFSEEWVAVETIIEEKQVRRLIPELKRLGAEGIIEYPLNKMIP